MSNKRIETVSVYRRLDPGSWIPDLAIRANAKFIHDAHFERPGEAAHFIETTKMKPRVVLVNPRVMKGNGAEELFDTCRRLCVPMIAITREKVPGTDYDEVIPPENLHLALGNR